MSLDGIEQEGGPDAAGAYNKRVVHWWPRRGVDIVEAPEGALLGIIGFRMVPGPEQKEAG